MTLDEAIAEVKAYMPPPLFDTSNKPGDMKTAEAFMQVYRAVASDQLIPRTDAEQAVAVAYQRAGAEPAQAAFRAKARGPREASILHDAAGDAERAIIALAPTDALAEVERMKAEIAELKTYRDYGPRMDEKRQAAIMELALGVDRLDQVEARQAAEAEVARLKEALADMWSGWKYIRMTHGDLSGVGWDRCDEKARAALKGDTP